MKYKIDFFYSIYFFLNHHRNWYSKDGRVRCRVFKFALWYYSWFENFLNQTVVTYYKDNPIQISPFRKQQIVMCDATIRFEDGNKQTDTISLLSDNMIIQKPDFSPYVLSEMAGSVWRCIYKSDRYISKARKYSLTFPLGVKFSEDRIFNLYAFGQANSVCYIKCNLYNRYINTESAIHRFHADYFEAYKKATDLIEIAIQNVWDNDGMIRKVYSRQYINGTAIAICNYFYKTSPLSLKNRISYVEKVCNDTKLNNIINKYGASSFLERCILNKNTFLLITYAILSNLKHRR